jgi:hypothetical protein
MAQMHELLEELARITGRHPETLTHNMRLLRTAGHVQAGRRGVLSQVEAKSAANLLIGCMSGVQPADTPRAVEVFSGLRPLRKGGFKQGFPTLGFVAKADTFGQALEQLLLLGPRLKREALVLLTVLFDRVPTEQLLDLRFFEIELLLQRQPAPYAKLTLEAVNEQGLYTHCFSQEWVTDSAKFMSGFYKPEMAAQTDLRTQTSITHRSIFRIGDLLAADSTEEQTDEASRIERKAGLQGQRHAGTTDQGGSREPRSYGYGESGLRLPQD